MNTQPLCCNHDNVYFSYCSPRLFFSTRSVQVSERVLGAVYGALSEAGVSLEGTLLKPQMIMAGVDAPEKKVSVLCEWRVFRNVVLGHKLPYLPRALI